MRLHELTPEQIEEWRRRRAEVGRRKYGDAHLQRYGLVDVMEELLDAQNIVELLVNRILGTDHAAAVNAQAGVLAIRSALWEMAYELQNLDKLLPDHVCSDEQGGERVWWSEQVRRDDEVCMCG